MSFRHAIARSAGVAGAVAALLVVGLAPAAPAAAAETPSVLVVLDASGSMKRTDASGVTLMEGAKTAVARVVDSLPAGTRVGLRAYGHTYPGEEKAVGCKDTAALSPVAPNNPARIKAAIAGLRPTGFTPIGHSLAQAVRDLPTDGPRTIVLVSDGEDTCTPPDPCEVAKSLRAQGVSVKVETVGLLLEGPKARGQLQCIAQATGGSYRDVSSVADLTSSLVDISGRAARGVRVGQPVKGTPSKADAPLITPGLYSDDIVVPEKLHYAFEAPAGARVTLRVTAPAVPSFGRVQRMVNTFIDAEAGGQLAYGVNLERGTLPISSSLVVRKVSDSAAGRLYVRIETDKLLRSDRLPGEQPLQIELEVTPAAGTSPSPTSTPSEQASATPPATTAAGSGTGTAPAGDDSGTPAWLLAVLAVMTLALVALAALVMVLLARMRRLSGGGPPSAS